MHMNKYLGKLCVGGIWPLCLHSKTVLLVLVDLETNTFLSHWVPFLPGKPWLNNTPPHCLCVEGAEGAYLKRFCLCFVLLKKTLRSLHLLGDPDTTDAIPSSTSFPFFSWPLPGQRKERKGGKRLLHAQKIFNKSPQLCFLHSVHTHIHKTTISFARSTTGISKFT